MKDKMTKFNVELYNDKMTKLDNLINDLNEIINLFSMYGQIITSKFFSQLMARPAETFDKYLSYKNISERMCDNYNIEKNEYDAPNYQKCYNDIASVMITILKAHQEFCELLPDITKAYDSFLFTIQEGVTPKVVKTKNAKWRIMEQCAEYKYGYSIIVKF